jgi:hypothetical protein
MASKNASGTHRSMGSKGGASVGLVDGVAEVQKHKAGQGVEVSDMTQRPSKAKSGSIAMK